MIAKQDVQELFPTPIWIIDLEPAAAATLNAQLQTEIDWLISPRPRIQAGANWQTPQDLHTRPAFAEFVKLVEMAARGVARYLQVDQYPMVITGCWANINPPGAYHPTHCHPNNYLSGVYYVAAPPPTKILFQDPRPVMIMPKPRQFSRVTANGAEAESKAGRMVLFPSWLRHNVPANSTEGDRVSIAFNLMFTNFAETLASPMWDPSAGVGKK